jgi:hypothetical protein
MSDIPKEWARAFEELCRECGYLPNYADPTNQLHIIKSIKWMRDETKGEAIANTERDEWKRAAEQLAEVVGHVLGFDVPKRADGGADVHAATDRVIWMAAQVEAWKEADAFALQFESFMQKRKEARPWRGNDKICFLEAKTDQGQEDN